MSEQPIMLGNRYRLDQVIGRGGMAEVWRAWDTRLGRDVAVKRLRADLATDPTFQARFQREAQSAAGLNHPNIVSVYDTGVEKDAATGIDIPFIVMELVQGTTLRDLLRDGRQILPERSLEFTAGVLDALAYAHRHGIVHRDIKPGNVMLTTTGTIKVMDFGIARAVSDTSATMTQTAAVIGTAQYLSPEQARGETVDARSDLYSVGCLLYELLTSRPPFVGDSPVSVAYQHVREQPVPPSRVDAELTPAMDVVVLAALAKDPADRYQSAQAMRDDVQRLLDGKPPIGAGARPVASTDSTRVLSDRPAPGARPRRGFTEVNAAATAAVPGADFELDDDDYADGGYADTGSSLLPAGAMDVEEPAASGRRLPVLAIVLAGLLVVLMVTAGIIMYQVMKPSVQEPTTIPVPQVVGLTEADAKQQLRNVNLWYSVITEAGPDDDTKGQVIRQSPDPDVQVDLGSTVQIWVNSGPAMGIIPDGLYGMTENAARSALQAEGFTNFQFNSATQEDVEEPITFVAGQVINVDPPSGTSYALSSLITITLSSGKSVVPNLVGMAEDAAKQFAKDNYGFDLAIDRQYIPGCDEGNVCQQRPDPGTYQLRTAKIFITVGLPAPDAPPTSEETP